MFIAGAGAGLTASVSLSRRAASFEEIARLISFIQTQIRYTAAPIGRIIERAAAGGFSGLSFLNGAANDIKKGENPCAAWCQAVKKHSAECSFNAADTELLQKFGQGLGSSDIKGQLSHCETFYRLFDDRLNEARLEARSKGRLYMTLGVAGGLGTALLLL